MVDLFDKYGIYHYSCKTEERQVTENCRIESGWMDEPIPCEDAGADTLVLLTILDTNRIIAEEIRNKNISSAFKIAYMDVLVNELEIIDCMRHYFNACSQVFIYGYGNNGQRIKVKLEEYNFKISGFVVSDEFYCEQNNVYKISQINNLCGIIISPDDDSKIIKTLGDLNFKYYYDGKKLLK